MPLHCLALTHVPFANPALLPCPNCTQTAMRTEPLGLDRHCQRYWWLLSDPGFLFVEDPDGQRIGAITSKEQLDEVQGGWGHVSHVPCQLLLLADCLLTDCLVRCEAGMGYWVEQDRSWVCS